MSPEECIAALDDALVEAGEDVILRRAVGQGTSVQNVDCKCLATIRTFRMREEEVATGIAQAVEIAVISPSDIARAQWPGGELPSLTVIHPNHPRRGDQMIVQGRMRMIEAVSPLTVQGVVVRFDLQLAG